ncbi:hypothetical protein ACFS6H_00710 [Terrimonas rubra]|uniref:Uncharacterized protein n=1 Tax=Terrimonas rubra TaxID=1035890 RepID=A0ABW6A166_9BACT
MKRKWQILCFIASITTAGLMLLYAANPAEEETNAERMEESSKPSKKQDLPGQGFWNMLPSGFSLSTGF